MLLGCMMYILELIMDTRRVLPSYTFTTAWVVANDIQSSVQMLFFFCSFVNSNCLVCRIQIRNVYHHHLNTLKFVFVATLDELYLSSVVVYVIHIHNRMCITVYTVSPSFKIQLNNLIHIFLSYPTHFLLYGHKQYNIMFILKYTIYLTCKHLILLSDQKPFSGKIFLQQIAFSHSISSFEYLCKSQAQSAMSIITQQRLTHRPHTAVHGSVPRVAVTVTQPVGVKV